MSGDTASRNCLVCWPGSNTAATQLPPLIHSPGSAREAHSPTNSLMMSGVAPGGRRHENSCMPAISGCTWTSWKPGKTVRPARSMTSVAPVRKASTEALSPTATMTPSRIAIDSAQPEGV